MNRADEDKVHPSLEDRNIINKDQSMELENSYNEEVGETDSDVKYKPIKLKIARGEVVANTALDHGDGDGGASLHGDDDVVMKEVKDEPETLVSPDDGAPSWAVETTLVLQLQEKLETESQLKERVSEIVGEDVLNIFATAVEEAESSQENRIDNKNVVFLYYAVKNSTNLDINNFNKNELEPLSNLALSVPLLSNLLTFLVKDQNIKEQMQTKIGMEDFNYFETISKSASENGDEFLQDESVTSRVVKLYHTARNLVLTEAFTRLASLYSKIDHIIGSVETTDDVVYNVAVAKFKSLVSSPWNQQVIAAEAMKFDFEFLNEVYTFWKKVIARRNKPEKKPKKPLKIKPLPPTKAADTYDIFGRPKRSTRRRNEMVTYDEDIMQDCNIKPGSKTGESEAEGTAPIEALTAAAPVDLATMSLDIPTE